MMNEEDKQYYLEFTIDNPTEYVATLADLKYKGVSITWNEISQLCAEKFHSVHSESYYRKNFTKEYVARILSDEITSSDLKESILELQKERVKLSDVLSQNRAYVRRLAREDTIKEIALEAAHIVKESLPLTFLNHVESPLNTEKEAILLLSDWHYGLIVDSYWNKYDVDIAEERIKFLLKEVIERCKREEISRIHVLNLGDLIAGRIHLPIRLESRVDTLTQIMKVSEILTEFLNELSNNISKVEYYSCIDNHSRVEPDKTQSLDLESLCRITDWYIKNRLEDNKRVEIHNNPYSEDIITLNVLDHKIIAVHGDKDKPSDAISKLSNFTRDTYDAVLMAHRHHFTADEECGTLVLGNGSLMGTDSYAKSLRMHSKPSQTLLFSTKERVADTIVRIVL